MLKIRIRNSGFEKKDNKLF